MLQCSWGLFAVVDENEICNIEIKTRTQELPKEVAPP